MNEETQSSNAAISQPQGESLARFCWGVAATGLAVLYTAVLSIFAALSALIGKPQGVAWIGRWWARMILGTAGIRVEVDGLEHIEKLNSFVLVANHQSLIDILALLAWFPRPVRFVAKKELLKIPVFGYALKNGGHILIDRQQGGQTVRKAVEVANSGICIVFFAEGHRFNDGRIHRFNPGAAWLALLCRLPCVPMAISGSAAMMPRGAKIVVPGRTMHLTLGAPIFTDSLPGTERNQLTRQLEQAVRDLFARANPAPAAADCER